MRFIEGGPDIPPALIDARNQGEVVFFCGAGISAPVGLPDFERLADDMLDRLAAQESRETRNRGETLDRVFMAMIKEFGGAAVDREMTRALRTPRHADLRFHRAAIDLSRGADGVAKIVTTNFDLLFERADRSLRAYVPPTLPDLAQPQPIQGVVYLHGRLNRSHDARAGYIISSADFGRAYLAEGWAARFVRELSERYTIVLLGYGANDPPMRYLLEGLNSRDDPSRRVPIYAFAPEGSEASEESWRDKGVTTIPYAPHDDAHSGLWDSLFAWAEAARDPEAWVANVVSLAQRQPADLKPFERSQVAHLVSTNVGAKAFASAQPLPPAQWLCVFDAYSRYAKPDRLDWRDKTEVDPLEVFGLDGDPPRPEPRPSENLEAPGDDLLGWRHGDQHWPGRQRLFGFDVEWTNQLTSRLYQLARWFGSVMDQPAAIWWAAGKPAPHPGVVREIGSRLDRGDPLSPPARHFWRCYLDACRAPSEGSLDVLQYEVVDRTKKEGWSKAVLRDLEHALTPSFRIARRNRSGSLPPAGDWDALKLSDLVEIEVRVSRLADGFDPPTGTLAAVTALFRRSLERMAEMLAESDPFIRRMPTLHPTGERGESIDDGGTVSYFMQFKALFDALHAHDVAAARTEAASWGSNDPFFFAKLFLYAATIPGLIEEKEVVRRILAIPDPVFWGSDLAREMLFAMRARWNGFTARDRARIERRIIAGRPQDEHESRAEYRQARTALSAKWLRWLELEGCSLSPTSAERLPVLIAADPRWSEGWARSAADSRAPRGGSIKRIKDSQGLETAPVREIVQLAATLSTRSWGELRDYRPFDGLVQKAPFKALAALRFVSRRSEHPVWLWNSLFDNWPEGARPRLNLLLAHTLARLPEPVFVELRHGIASWVEKFIGVLIQNDREDGLAALDAIVLRYATAEPSTLASSSGFARIGGVVQDKSEVSFTKAINSPGGKLARAVFGLIEQPHRRNPMPGWIGTRIEGLLRLPGEGAGHAACVIAQRFGWFADWFADWAARLIPLFALDHPLAEGMWHGFAADPDLFSIGNATGRRIKPALMGVLLGDAPWALDPDARRALIDLMVALTSARPSEPSVISFAEARRVLIAGSDEDRAGALGLLARSMRPGEVWSILIRPFLRNAWPRQLRYQTESTSRQLAQIAENAGDRFPEVVTLILPLLRPVAHLVIIVQRLNKQGEEGQSYSVRFPADSLRLLDALVGNDPQNKPWNLAEALDAIAETAPALRQSDPWRRLKALTQ